MALKTTSGADILFGGDVHGCFDHLAPLVRAHAPKALVLLGDIEADRPLAEIAAPWEALGCAVWFIPGNHDSDSLERWQALAECPERNLDGRVVEIAGVRIAGLGGVFRETIWDGAQAPRYVHYEDYAAQLARRVGGAAWLSVSDRGRSLRHRTSIFPGVHDRLVAEQADILVTHEAPSCHPHGFAAIDELARCLGVRRLFHGHHHDNRDYGPGNELGFTVHGVGLRGVSDGNGRVLRAGERDRERSGRL